MTTESNHLNCAIQIGRRALRALFGVIWSIMICVSILSKAYQRPALIDHVIEYAWFIRRLKRFECGIRFENRINQTQNIKHTGI